MGGRACREEWGAEPGISFPVEERLPGGGTLPVPYRHGRRTLPVSAQPAGAAPGTRGQTAAPLLFSLLLFQGLLDPSGKAGSGRMLSAAGRIGAARKFFSKFILRTAAGARNGRCRCRRPQLSTADLSRMAQ